MTVSTTQQSRLEPSASWLSFNNRKGADKGDCGGVAPVGGAALACAARDLALAQVLIHSRVSPNEALLLAMERSRMKAADQHAQLVAEVERVTAHLNFIAETQWLGEVDQAVNATLRFLRNRVADLEDIGNRPAILDRLTPQADFLLRQTFGLSTEAATESVLT